MNKLFNARSPFWQLLFALETILFIALLSTTTVQSDSAIRVSVSLLPYLFFLIPLLATFGIYAWVLQRYNQNHPKESALSPWDVYPPELIESDEMMRSVSQSAAKKVYLYNTWALPLLVLVLLMGKHGVAFMAVAFSVYIIGYYITYLRVIWPHLGE